MNQPVRYIVRLAVYSYPLTLDTTEHVTPAFSTRSEAEAYAIRLSQRGHLQSWRVEEVA